MTKEYKNVLIARFSALGDVAMTVPVVYSACEAYPTVRFVIATQPVASSLFVNPPQNLTVVGVDASNATKARTASGVLWATCGANTPLMRLSTFTT